MVPLKILVVDDDNLSRDLLRMLLVREGYRTETAGSGEGAIAMLEAADEWPGLVLTDLQMPGISGTALARRLRESSATVRLLAMSGSLPADGALEGFDGFLRKPFSMAALAAAIRATGKAAEQRTANASATPPSSPVLDSDLYRKLESAMKPEKLTQLYTLCLEDVRCRVAAMRIAADSGDDATYRRAAHAIKGECGMVGALELQTIAASEENAGIPANHVATLHEFLKAAQRLEGMLFANNKTSDAPLVRPG